jgi:hypothetical protein
MNLREKLRQYIALNSYVEKIQSDIKSTNLVDAIHDGLVEMKAKGMSKLVPETYLDSVVANGKSALVPETYLDTVTAKGGTSLRKVSREYEELEYVTFNGTQIVDTNVICNEESRIESKWIANSSSIWVYGTGTTNPRITCYCVTSGNQRFGNATVDSTGITHNVLNTVIQDKNGFYYNGTGGKPYSNVGTFTCANTLTIGNSNGSTGTPYFTGNFYYMKIYQNNKLALNLVPAKRKSDNVVGFYNTINNSFITPSTGTLAAGPIVSVPDGYTRLAYLTGDGAAYIDLGISLTQDDEFELDFIMPSSSISTQNIFGYRNSASSNAMTAMIASTNNAFVTDFNNSDYSPYRLLTNISASTSYKVITNKNSRALYQGDTLVDSNTTVCGDTITTGNVLVFNIDGSPAYTNKFTGSISRVIVKNRINLIPVKRNSDGVLGMYDTINNQFYTNAAETGAFIAGPEIGGDPNNPYDIYCNNGKLIKTANEANYIASNVTLGYWLRNSDGQPEASGQNFYTAMMLVKPNTSYVCYGRNKNDGTLSKYNRIAWYDANGTWISNCTYTVDTITVATSPANAVYARFHCNPLNSGTVTQETVDSFNWTFCEGTQEVDYVPFLQIVGTKEYLQDSKGNLALIADLFGLTSDTQDIQELVSGVITHKTMTIILTGAEEWGAMSNDRGYYTMRSDLAGVTYTENTKGISSHFPYTYWYPQSTDNLMPINRFTFNRSSNGTCNGNISFRPDTTVIDTVDKWKAWLTEQYFAGTPVIVVYPLNTATTETVSSQYLQKSPVTITQSSLDGLEVAYTESSHSVPTPDYPLDIICNNGVLKLNNVHNIATDTLGGYINKSTGIVVENPSYGYTDYIPVTAGQVFKITQRGSSTTDADGVLQYDSDKVWQSSQSINALGGTYTVPSGISYIRLNFNINYQQFVIEDGIYTDGIVETLIAYSSDNLYTPTTPIINAYVNANNGTLTAGNPGSSTQYSFVIPCKSNTTYKLDGMTALSGWGSFTNSTIGTVATIFTKGNDTLTTGPNDQYLIGMVYATGTSYDYRNTLDIRERSNIATCEDLLSVDTYIDTQDVISGTVTRNIGIKVLDGTENWQDYGAGRAYLADIFTGLSSIAGTICSHFTVTNTNNHAKDMNIDYGGVQPTNLFLRYDAMNTLANIKQYLADQYAAGTPVIVVYPLATATTETVSKQILQKSPVSIVEASMDNLTVSEIESVHTTPSPDYPLDIVCNNGKLGLVSPVDGYTQIEYLESSGAQYLDLNRVPNNNDIIEQKFQKKGTNTATCSWYGSMPSSSTITPRMSIGTFSSNSVATIFAGSNYTGMIGAADTNVHTLRFQSTGQTELTYTFDGVTGVIDASTASVPIDMYEPAVEFTSYLFARHGTDGVQVYDNEGTRIFYHKEYLANGTLVMDLIPVKRNSDGVLGMYDKVSGSFFTNLGTGTLIAGPVVPGSQGNPETIVLHSKNLYDTSKDTAGKYIDANGNISVEPFSSYSELLEVKPGEVYTYSGICNQGSTASANNKRIHGYINGVWNQQISVTTVDKFTPFYTTFTIPAGINGIRISHWTDDTYTQLEKSYRPTKYEAYGSSIAYPQDLLNISGYFDEQDITTGLVTRRIGVKVLDGSENWGDYATASGYNLSISDMASQNYGVGLCSHFNRITSVWVQGIKFGANNSTIYVCQVGSKYPNVTAWKQYLADQYAAGTPVIVVYPLATPITENVDDQDVVITAGNSELARECEYDTNLPLEVTYKKLK